EEPPLGAAPPLPLLLAAPEVIGHGGRILVGGLERRVVRAQKRDHRMAEGGEGDVEPARLVALARVAAALAAPPAARHGPRAVAHAVVAVAREVPRRELPVARDQPLVDAADHLGAALAPVPRVEEEIEVELVAADVVEERRCRLVPGGPDRALVVDHLRDL